MNTPEHILKIIRQRIDLDEKDTKRDAEIDAMRPMDKLRHLVGWELGDEEWADTILSMAEECGLQITNATNVNPQEQFVYLVNGFASRQDYLKHLKHLCEDYPEDVVMMLADLLGSEEDFDGLVTELADHFG